VAAVLEEVLAVEEITRIVGLKRIKNCVYTRWTLSMCLVEVTEYKKADSKIARGADDTKPIADGKTHTA
jgi:hypothetical protein